MKTFEERYTAWIDGQLSGSALTSFEQELARRAEAGDAAAELDKADALQLRALLKEHLQAPVLTNTEFFSHQMRDRIDSEVAKAAARREAATRPGWKFPAFAWPFARLAGVGVVCLFVAGALYYGMVPQHQAIDQRVVVVPANSPQKVGDAVATNDSPVPPTQNTSVERPDNNKLALLTTPTPTPIDINDDIHVVNPGAGSNASATALHVGNANVIWLNNPPYLPGTSANSTAPLPAPSAAPASSVAPDTKPQP